MSGMRQTQVVDIFWDEEPPYFVLRGHVEGATAKQICSNYYEDKYDGIPFQSMAVVMCWGRWGIPTAHVRANGCDVQFYLFRSKAVGSFPITVLHDGLAPRLR